MELALLMAPRGSTLEAIHVWSEENLLADTLSRMADDKLALPIVLAKVRRSAMHDKDLRILGQR